MEEVRLVSEKEKLRIELRGDLAVISTVAQKGYPGGI